MKKILFFFFSLFILNTLSAQRGWEAGGWLGTSYYFGDLNTRYDLSKPGLAAGAIARYNFNRRLCVKLSGNYGNVQADDANSDNIYEKARNLNFQSVIVDGTAQFEFNFFSYTHGSKDEFYTPYLFAGMTVFYFEPKTEYNGELVELRPLGTEGQFRGEEYYSIKGGLAYGGGLKMDLSFRWSLNLEIGARYLFTDYLDDVSTVYPDKEDLEDFRGPLAVALSDRSIEIPGVERDIAAEGRQRGNANNNDSYVFIGLGLVYYFGDLRCPEYSR